MLVPTQLQTERLLLRPWQAGDAANLLPILEANYEHLSPWIPARIADPAPTPALAERLAGFNADFVAAREWRYALLTLDESRLLGEVSLFPRAAAGRVALAQADRIEIGYWLRTDATGLGLATEAARAALHIASALPGLTHAEIRCDARNAPSAAVPRRLGFQIAHIIMEPGATRGDEAERLQVWTRAFDSRSP